MVWFHTVVSFLKWMREGVAVRALRFHLGCHTPASMRILTRRIRSKSQSLTASEANDQIDFLLAALNRMIWLTLCFTGFGVDKRLHGFLVGMPVKPLPHEAAQERQVFVGGNRANEQIRDWTLQEALAEHIRP